jgi:hypothetical protein
MQRADQTHNCPRATPRGRTAETGLHVDCPHAIESREGTRGTLVDAFGVYASPAVAAVLEGVPFRRP